MLYHNKAIIVRYIIKYELDCLPDKIFVILKTI